MGNVLETERLLFDAKNSVYANRQRKPLKANYSDYYRITLLYFGMLF